MPMRRELYPSDWPAISLRVRERDGWRCVSCGVANGMVVARDRNGEWFEVPSAFAGAVRIVLTVAHLLGDDPADCRDENLAALCQRCHLRLDGPLHARHAAETRRRRRVAAGQSELFETQRHGTIPTEETV